MKGDVMYKQPSYFEEEKISLRNNKIALFCIAIAIATIVIVVVTGVLAYRLIKNDFGTEDEQIAGSKTVGKTTSPTGEVIPEKTEVPENTTKPQQMTQSMVFPKHDFSVAMESQLPQYSEEIAKKVVNVYFEETKKVYLTFDDGPSRVTDDILDILDKYNVKATFFVLGSNVDAKPELVKRAYDSGHFIASHGYTHKYSQIYESQENVLAEYNQSVEAIRRAIGVPAYNPHLFRYPGGSSGGTYNSVKQQSINLLKQNNVTYTNWNCLTGDSAGSTTIDDMWRELNASAEGDDNLVILMHDAGDKDVTVEFLPQLIEKYLAEGYEFCNYYDIMM